MASKKIEHTHPEESKKRKRKALLALGLLQKRLKKLCGTFETAEEWEEYLQEYLEPILDEYGGVIPKSVQKKLRKASHTKKSSAAGLRQTCRVLRSELAAAGAIVPSMFAGIVKGAVVAVAVTAGVVGTYIYTQSVDVTITNNGCSPIETPAYAQIPIPGISLPSEVIYDGGSAQARVPISKVSVDARGSNIKVTLLGATMSFPMTIRDVTVNGESILGKDQVIDLKAQPENEVVISC